MTWAEGDMVIDKDGDWWEVTGQTANSMSKVHARFIPAIDNGFQPVEFSVHKDAYVKPIPNEDHTKDIPFPPRLA